MMMEVGLLLAVVVAVLLIRANHQQRNPPVTVQNCHHHCAVDMHPRCAHPQAHLWHVSNSHHDWLFAQHHLAVLSQINKL